AGGQGGHLIDDGLAAVDDLAAEHLRAVGRENRDVVRGAVRVLERDRQRAVRGDVQLGGRELDVLGRDADRRGRATGLARGGDGRGHRRGGGGGGRATAGGRGEGHRGQRERG